MVTYKHPLKVRASSWGGQAELRTFIAEATILPCSITLQGGKQDHGFAPNTSMMADNKLPTATEYEHGFKDLSRKHLQGFEASVCFPTCSQQEGKACETSAVRFEMLDIRRVHNGLPMESSGEMHLSKVLLEFSSDTVEFYSLLRVGECYLLQFNHQFNNLQRHGARTSKVSVGAGMHLWSLHIALQDRQEPVAMQHVADDPNAENEQVLADTKSKLGLQFESVSNWMEVDVVVHLPREGVDAFRKLVWHQQAQIVPPVLSLRDALQQSHISLSTDPREAEVRRTRLVSSHCLPATNRSFVGELVSLTGRVEKVSLQGCFKDGLASNKSQATASLRRQCVDIEVEVTDLAGPERVKVLLTFIPDTLPAGLGQGATVTFHRIVPYTALPDFTVCCRSSAATSVVVHTIPQVPFGCVEEGLGLSTYDGGGDIIRLVSTLKRMGPDYVVRGRVVRVRRVIFRWQGDACSRRDMRPNIMGSSSISTSAHFTIDDGTRNIACWAAGQAATSLLGLAGAGGQLQLRGPLLEPQKDVWCRPAGSLGMEVASLVQKHEQIFIQNNSWDGCEADAGASCLSINGAGSYPPGVNEQALLKSLVLQACNNRQWDLLCEVRVSKRKTFQANANTQRHYLYVLSVKPVEYIRDLKNKCDRLFSLLTE